MEKNIVLLVQPQLKENIYFNGYKKNRRCDTVQEEYIDSTGKGSHSAEPY